MPSLSILLHPDAILELEPGSSQDALGALVRAAASGADLDPGPLLAAVLERERLCSTGFGGGVAMPHVRLQGVRRFVLALGRARHGVEFGAIDGEPVRLFLLVVGPESEQDRYKKVMAKAAKLLKERAESLLEAEDLRQAAALAAAEY